MNYDFSEKRACMPTECSRRTPLGIDAIWLKLRKLEKRYCVITRPKGRVADCGALANYLHETEVNFPVCAVQSLLRLDT
eukprot:1197982-Amphidinium_carterae.1